MREPSMRVITIWVLLAAAVAWYLVGHRVIT